MQTKYYIIQNGYLTGYTDKTLAESIYSLSKQASLIEILPDNTALLFNRAYTSGLITCDDLNSAIYIAGQLAETPKSAI